MDNLGRRIVTASAGLRNNRKRRPFKPLFKPVLKPVVAIGFLVLGVLFLPEAPVDPWHLLNLQKMAKMLLALTAIQLGGAALKLHLGPRFGALLTGFAGGLISSTAVTAGLAREGRQENSRDTTARLLSLLAATGGMLLEAAALVATGLDEAHPSLFLLFALPAFTTVALIVRSTRSSIPVQSSADKFEFRILPLLGLAAFVIAVVSASKLLALYVGGSSLYALTFFVSLFEIHGSLIASVQMHESNAASLKSLGTLIAISLAASYLSKFFLVAVLGDRALRQRTLSTIAVVLASVALGWIAFNLLVS
jgi:uncharacterized membrane protein (DUF4010 family)